MCNHCPLQCNFFSFHSRRQCFVLFPSLSSHATFCFIYLPMPRSSAQESLVNLDPKTNAQILFTFFLFGNFFSLPSENYMILKRMVDVLSFLCKLSAWSLPWCISGMGLSEPCISQMWHNMICKIRQI